MRTRTPPRLTLRTSRRPAASPGAASSHATNPEDRFRRLFEEAAVGMAEIDTATGHFLQINRCFCDLVGYTAEEILDTTFQTITHADDLQEDLDNMESLRAGKIRFFSMEKRHFRKDGSVIWVDLTVSPMWAPGESPTTHVAIVQDITERKQAEAALRESEERFRITFDKSPIGAAMVSLDYRFLRVNEELCRITGYTEDELTRLGFPDITHPDDVAQDVERAQQLLTGDIDHYEMEKRYIRKDGGNVWIRVVVRLVRGATGTPLYFLPRMEDITERRKAQAALEESERQHRLLVQHLHSGVVVHAADTRVVLANDRASALLGLTVDQMMGKAAVDPAWCFSREDGTPMPVDEYPVERVLAERQPVRDQVAGINRLASHDRVWVLVNAFPELDADGHIRQVVVTFVDITDLKCAQTEVQQLNETLEQRVRERTGELEASNKELEAFSYSVSHDLRAPLRAIDGFSRILLEDYGERLDEVGRRTVDVICSETHRMGQLIDALLTLSRLDRQGLEVTEVDMTALARAAFDDLVAAAPDRVVRLTLHALPPGHGDRALLRQVWVNLLANALKFTRHVAAPAIEVGGRVDGDHDVYYVRDNGVGFDMRYADKLFGVFQRLHHADEFEGTGVGLAIVQRMIRRHAGRVWASAAPNQGATFFFSLPRHKESS